MFVWHITTQMVNFSMFGLGESFVKCSVTLLHWSVWNRGEISPLAVFVSKKKCWSRFSSRWAAAVSCPLALPAALCLLPSLKDLTPGVQIFVTYTSNCQHGRQESVRHKDQFSRQWGMCVQPSVSLAEVQFHSSTHACTPRYVAGLPGGGCGSLLCAGWAALLCIAADSMRCKTYEVGMRNPTGLFIPPVNS